MPCHVRSTRSSRRRRKFPPSLLRQVRLLKRLSARWLRRSPPPYRAREAMARPRRRGVMLTTCRFRGGRLAVHRRCVAGTADPPGLSRMQRWQQEAHRFHSDRMLPGGRRAGPISRKRCTCAIASRMVPLPRTDTGCDHRHSEANPRQLRGTRAGTPHRRRLTIKALAQLAGLDDKTIGNVEAARFFVSRKTIAAFLPCRRWD